jgi:hypothetical protein
MFCPRGPRADALQEKQMKFAHVLFVIGLIACPRLTAAQMPMDDTHGSALVGTVAESMDAGRYTYLKIRTPDGETWVATLKLDVHAGDVVTVRGGNTMKNFNSPTLNRTFESILFAGEVQVGTNAPAARKLPAGHPPVSAHGEEQTWGDPDAKPVITGEIVETMDTGDYTYVLVRDGERSVWAAAEKFQAVVGDTITVPDGMLVKNFDSPSLGRSFDEIYFVESILAPRKAAPAPAAAADFEPYKEEVQAAIAPPDGGVSIADVYAQRDTWSGKEVTVRGRVTKFTQRVMGRNWMHLSDGSGTGDDKDLTVTTQGLAEIGDIVTATGTLTLNEDFGYSYQYPVLLNDAQITREN